MIETTAQPVLKPLLHGEAITLGVEEQTILRAWIVLRAMILERGASAPGARLFYTDDERRAFADIEYEGSLEPLDGTYIWIFQHRSDQWVARSNVANIGLHMVPSGPPTHHLQVITGIVFRFGFQILVGRWPKRRRLELNSLPVRNWESVAPFLWPDSSDVITWPPSFYLGDDGYEPFLDRFLKPGFPLQRGRRRSS